MHWIDAAVEGNLGPGVDYDVTREPTLRGELAYEFDDWRGDDLVTTAEFWLCTERLADALRASDLTGWTLDSVRVSTSDVFDDLHPGGLELPTWYRLIPGADGDIQVRERVFLCVSDSALALLRRFDISHAEIRPLSAIPPLPNL